MALGPRCFGPILILADWPTLDLYYGVRKLITKRLCRLENRVANRELQGAQAHARAVKGVYVYPLVRDARQQLCEDLTQ